MRRLALALAATAAALLPAALKPWGKAMRQEVAAISQAGAAILFALGCLGAAVRQALAHYLLGDHDMMSIAEHPRRLTALCAVAATALGLFYMAAGGAPARYFVINIGALALAFATVAVAAPAARSGRIGGGGVNLALGAILLLLTLVGVTVEGATRWIAVAGLSIQPSLVLLPVLAVGFARHRHTLSLAGILLAALAVALQPDRAMAGALAAGLAALALVRTDRHSLVAAAGGSAGFVAAMAQPDVQGAMPFVDQILYTSFAIHPLAGAAVLLGSTLLVAPAAIGWVTDPGNRAAYATLGALWLAIIAAAALGNYPTPLVGYGGSAIIGYVLCLIALPRQSQDATATAVDPPSAPQPPRLHRSAHAFLLFPRAGKPC